MSTTLCYNRNHKATTLKQMIAILILFYILQRRFDKE